jgi:hypothetical protein
MDIFAEWAPVVLVGAGWYPKETSKDGIPFRWVRDGAWIDLTQLPALAYDVMLDVEPGPAVGLQRFELVLYKDGKTRLAALEIPGRKKVTFRLAAGDPTLHHIELRAESTAKAVDAPGDARTLKYRIFSIVVTPIPDVSEFERKIAQFDKTVADQRAKLAELESAIAAEREPLESAISQLQREVSARDAVIERLEQIAARLRAEIEELQRAGERQHAEIELQASLAEERLSVIRALHEQNQNARA